MPDVLAIKKNYRTCVCEFQLIKKAHTEYWTCQISSYLGLELEIQGLRKHNKGLTMKNLKLFYCFLITEYIIQQMCHTISQERKKKTKLWVKASTSEDKRILFFKQKECSCSFHVCLMNILINFVSCFTYLW